MVDRHALLHKTFVAMDADGSGFVDESEFLSIFDDHEVKHAKARMAEIDLVSGSDDGLIGAEEFCKFMLEYMIAMQDQAFKHKVARWQENVKGSHRKLLLRRVFKKMDVDINAATVYKAANTAVTVCARCDVVCVFVFVLCTVLGLHTTSTSIV